MASGTHPKVPFRDFEVLKDDGKHIEPRSLAAGARPKLPIKSRNQSSVKRDFEVLKDNGRKHGQRSIPLGARPKDSSGHLKKQSPTERDFEVLKDDGHKHYRRHSRRYSDYHNRPIYNYDRQRELSVNSLYETDVSNNSGQPCSRNFHHRERTGNNSNTPSTRLDMSSVQKEVHQKRRDVQSRGRERKGRFTPIVREHYNFTQSRSTHQLDITELKAISSLTPKDILTHLSAEGNGFEDLLQEQEMSREVQLLLLNVLSKACECTSLPMLLNNMLVIVWKSTYLTKHLQQLVTNLFVPSEESMDDRLKTTINGIMKLTHGLLKQIPSSYSEVGVLIVLLENALKQVVHDEESFGEILKRLQDITELYKTIAMDEKDRVHQAVLKAHYKPPPNNFRQIPILPKSKELREDQQPFLRANLTTGKYVDSNHYLDVQFRLLREDFVAPLRQGISDYLAKQNNPNEHKRLRIADLRLYTTVNILNPMVGKDGIVHKLQFDIKPLAKVQWESSKRLLPGSLVCLTKNDFRTVIFAIVEKRDTKDLLQGRLVVRFNSLNDIIGTNSSESFLMAETMAYFEQYRPILLGLQEMGKQDAFGNTHAIPMEQYIVYASRNIHPPSYLCDREDTFYDLRHLTWEQNREEKSYEDENAKLDIDKSIQIRQIKMSKARWVPLLETGLWPSAETLHFNESQLAAFQTALIREFALIQGPPGTGKTYVGLKVVQTLLFNRHVWGTQSTNEDTTLEGKHILVVCYTNHALDQFLEGIQKFEENIIRIGGGSSSEMLKSRNLAEIRYQRRRRRMDQRRVHPDYDRLKRLLENAEDRLGLARKGVISDQSLQPYMTKTQVSSFNLFGSHQYIQIHEGTIILYWLGLVDDQQEKASDGKMKQLGHFLQEIEVENDDDTIEVLGEAELIAQLRQMEEEDPNMRANRSKRQKILLNEFAFVIGSGSRHANQTSEDIKRMEEIVKYELENMQDVFSEQKASEIVNVWSVHPEHRWRLYRYWLVKYVEAHEKMMLQYQEIYQNLAYQQKEIEIEEDEKILKEAKVIGMTTTGAAKHRSLLQLIKPRIIVIEEAAEVLEAHIITTLTSDCQHLILIGDHQQLRPNPTVYRLAKQFKLDISLFERMINNRLPCQQLHLQHRMRPEISTLMKRHFYKHLDDHQSVLKYDNVLGVRQNVFFIQHNEEENEVDDIKSKSNSHEATFLVQLCRYFIQQGYSPSQITILTAYTGQLLIFKRQMDRRTFEGVKVCVVDNYQGEENDIILLSLVRSNEEGKVGFLKVDNRVCVALSRARKGLFCIGNLSLLAEKSNLWKDIIGTLKEKQMTGWRLPLVCKNHSKISEVAFAKDFQNIPDGGCCQACGFRLPCGHVCEKSCHPIDPDHKSYVCRKPCARKCVRDHLCKRKCADDCKCVVELTVTMTECNHTQTMLCNEFESWICMIPCEKTLLCGHLCTRVCGKPCLPSTLCKEPCEQKCVRHHSCKLRCGEVCRCEEKVEKTMFPCQHMQSMACHEFDTWSCKAPCERKLECGHSCPETCGTVCPSRFRCQAQCTEKCVRDHQCKLKCSDDCECDEIVTKTMPRCGHEQTMSCFEYDSWVCREPCEKKLVCGHTCMKMCHQKCENMYEMHKPTCTEEVEITLPECQHKVKILCKDNPEMKKTRLRELLKLGSSMVNVLRTEMFKKTYPQCVEKCKQTLPCGHECANKCTKPCTVKCNTTIEKTLPCGHQVKVLCYDADNAICKEQCTRELPCGHICLKPCRDKCTCELLLDKKLPDCGHAKRMKCGSDPNDAVCDRPCSRVLPCGHNCKNRCRDPCQTWCYEIVSKKLPDCEHQTMIACEEETKNLLCESQCSKELPCGHVCEKKCLEPCASKCKVKVEKVLDCGHKQLVECWREVKDLQCTKKCAKRLPCGHPCQNVCSKPCNSKCEVRKKKTLPKCHHFMFVKCFEDVSDVTCTGPCKKKLLCEHKCRKRCGDPCETKCQVKTEKIMKDCNHRQTIPCFVDIKDHICQAHCKKQLKCGHRCVERCGEPCNCRITKKRKIPGCRHIQLVQCQIKVHDHICQEKCSKKLACGHFCPRKCGEPCVGQCEQVIEKVLPGCKHRQKVPCYMHPNDFKCKARCKRKLSCGHLCKNKCADPCMETCQVAVRKKLRGCQHTQTMVCSEDISILMCKYQCSKHLICGHQCVAPCGEQCRCDTVCGKRLPCGHECKERCGEPCTQRCDVKVCKVIGECGHHLSKAIACYGKPTRADCDNVCGKKLICGHMCDRPCNTCDAHNAGRYDCEEEQAPCTAKCDVLLQCGHRCMHSCTECYGGRIHKPCKNRCGRTLLCGCQCRLLCMETCKCKGYGVNDNCPLRNEPFRRFTRLQRRRLGGVRRPCKHFSSHFCNEPCERKLRCGHRCIGICGEPCIPLCRFCEREKVLKIFPEYQVSEDPCYITLIPCGHVAEYQSVCRDHIDSKNYSIVRPICCPTCRGRVYNDRFADIVTAWEKNVKEINILIARKLEIHLEEGETLIPVSKLHSRRLNPDIVSEHFKMARVWMYELLKVEQSLQERLKKAKDFADVHGISVKSEQLLQSTSTVIKEAIAGSTGDTGVISHQMAQDFTRELNRLHCWCEVLEALSEKKLSPESVPSVSTSISEAIDVISTPCSFTAQRYMDVEKLLDEFHRELHGTVRKRNPAIKLPYHKLNPPSFGMGMWFKCRNKHYFNQSQCEANRDAGVKELTCPYCMLKDVNPIIHSANETNAELRTEDAD